jgi:hypothetical protein
MEERDALIHVLQEQNLSLVENEKVKMAKLANEISDAPGGALIDDCSYCHMPFVELYANNAIMALKCDICEAVQMCRDCRASRLDSFCGVCGEWCCDDCVRKDPRRKVYQTENALNEISYECGRHYEGYVPLDT